MRSIVCKSTGRVVSTQACRIVSLSAVSEGEKYRAVRATGTVAGWGAKTLLLPARPILSAGWPWLVVVLLLVARAAGLSPMQYREGYFNGSAEVRLLAGLDLRGHTGLSFRTCRGGELFAKETGGGAISLRLLNSDGLLLAVTLASGRRYEAGLSANLADNAWHSVNLKYSQGNISLGVAGHTTVVANKTFNTELMNNPNLFNDNSTLLYVGRGFTGCILEGPTIVLNVPGLDSQNVEWGRCPLNANTCTNLDYCRTEPCMQHGACLSRPDRYECHCAPRYSGNNCETDNGPLCERNGTSPCKNGGICEEDNKGNYKCICDATHTGLNCENVINSPTCEVNPCLNNGSCRVENNRDKCICHPGFTGEFCEVNIDDCEPNPCQNGGICQDGINNYSCVCTGTGYNGYNCEENINECEVNSPCLNGICFDNYGGYTCQCYPGFGGQNCEMNSTECSSGPCQNGGLCTNVPGSYVCQCRPGYTGHDCEVYVTSCEQLECPPTADCLVKDNVFMCVCRPGFHGFNCSESGACAPGTCRNGGSCLTGTNRQSCNCLPGYTGSFCERPMDWCTTVPCLNGGTCTEEDICVCPPSFTGPTCQVHVIQCLDNPCLNAISCTDEAPNNYVCTCIAGWTGRNCERPCGSVQCDPETGECDKNVVNSSCDCEPGRVCQSLMDECASSPCRNGGACLLQRGGGYLCNCTKDYTGPSCEHEVDACASSPCQNNGTCITRSRQSGTGTGYICECNPGFAGSRCEVTEAECQPSSCPEHMTCVSTATGIECQCREGVSGENCSVSINNCQYQPCLNGGTCIANTTTGHYVCVCPPDFTGARCKEMNMVVCKENSSNCLHGICHNTPGSHQCYCQPGYSGIHCDINFDECLSRPCLNGATCEDKINDYGCVCPPGYTGKDCGLDIDECKSNPCSGGATCQNGIGFYICICPPGLEGDRCQINIDDCKSMPCLNSGVCQDQLNDYVCHCNGTGFQGTHCETNVDDCNPNPCMNGGQCKDKVNDFECYCHKGYTGTRCEIDVDECTPNPCQYDGICFENSKIESYRNPEYPRFNQQLTYSNASGYMCVCAMGTSGINCQHNHNECDSSPCANNGNCVDQVNSFICECTDGFEGTRCEHDINECERYQPCGAHGTCIDRRADYSCECNSKYGGKNCSVELTGCHEDSCHHNGTCTPYLENETEHKFNCSCPKGFHGDTCEMVTTMSITDKSRVQVVTRREEGYDIRFRFKTTLPDCLLAIGKGLTYYSLELYRGRLNLHSSLLNKWEGVFIGSDLANGTKWQKVFVQINSSHVVLAANEEQTIHPINLNEGTNISHTSFPTTFLGTAIPELRSLAHASKRFVGCMEDVVVNSEWVILDHMPSNSSIDGVAAGCPREPQCEPNPCQNGGVCTDQWSDFKCACERPNLGHTCQYNLTAATFGHENETRSMVTVRVSDAARKAIRSIMDISMFIRTRQDKGAIFYMTSVGNADETVIAAQMEGSELFVRILLNGTLESYTVGSLKLADGNNHLIQVVRNVTLVQVKINGTEYFRKTISAMGHLDVQMLYLGAFPPPPPPTRTVRQAPEINPNTIRCDVNFKGVIQDVQVTNGTRTMVVEFFPLRVPGLEIPPKFGEVYFARETVLEGIVSDDSCRSNPCDHDGVCYITWNDFRCECKRGYKGKMCQEMEFCQIQDCPEGSKCRNLENGYECVANITFGGQNSSLQFVLNRPLDDQVYSSHESPLNSISITYRSRMGGTILHISSRISSSNSSEYFSVSVLSDEVTVLWRLEADGLGHIQRFHKDPTGEWTTIVIRMQNDEISGGFDGMGEDSLQLFTVGNFSMAAWKTLVRTGLISLGSGPIFNTMMTASVSHERLDYLTVNAMTEGNPATPIPDLTTLDSSMVELPHTVVNGGHFKGCLGEVRIGNLLLPYFTANQLNSDNLTAKEHFSLHVPPEQSLSFSLDLGCVLCFDSECYNMGMCANPKEAYNCSCVVGFQGDYCETNIDECLLEPQCKNNSTCVDDIANYTCSCLPGYEGWLCDVDIDECKPDPCQNQGTCIDRIGTFECICTEDFTGTFCEQRRLITCEDFPCRNGSTCSNIRNTKTGDNFTCICARGYEGIMCDSVYCAVTPCQNGGICNEEVPMCRCNIGYSGDLCELDTNECASNPCDHGGICEDLLGGYICNCSQTGYTGLNCEIDIDECLLKEYQCVFGKCLNTRGSYQCDCTRGYCGINCNVLDPCQDVNPCKNGGVCQSDCTYVPGYKCDCVDGHTGTNCTVHAEEATGTSAFDIIIIVAPIVAVLLIVMAIALSVFISMARKKRATRGTYSPSQQEYCNPRVELDNVMKPPPEERLI